jgi:hypothetical protein
MKTRIIQSLLLAAVCLSRSFTHAASPEPVDTLAKLSLEWVRTRAEAVRAETEWAGQRDLLDSTVKALEERAKELESKRDLAKAKTANERGELGNMEIENQRLTNQFSQLEASLKSFDEQIAKLRPQFPPKLSQALELPLLSLADPKLTPSERMAHTMTVLNRCVQFNRCVTFGEEIVAAPGEAAPKLLQTVYWGLSHGYAYDKTARKAWLGSPGPEGWKWTSCPEGESAIREMIATFDEKAEPKFVAVPAAAGRLIELTTTK